MVVTDPGTGHIWSVIESNLQLSYWGRLNQPSLIILYKVHKYKYVYVTYLVMCVGTVCIALKLCVVETTATI